MRLDVRSVPYRAGATVARLAWLIVIVSVTSRGMGPGLGAPLALVVGGALGLTVVYQFVYWQRFDYELTDDTLDIRSGVVSRRNREIPYRRIQNVDITRNVVHRLLGVAEVRIETAGGSETEAQLQYVAGSEAQRLQDELSRLKRGAAPANGETAEASPPELLFAITPKELLLLGSVSVDFRIVSFLSVAVPVAAPSLAGAVEPFAPAGARLLSPVVVAPIGVVVLYLASALVGGVIAVTNYYGFRLARDDDELRYERGLFQRFSGTIPLGKVQTLTVRANALARAIGYASLAVETAGYTPGDENGSQSAVPFAERDRVFSLARSIEAFDPPEFERPPVRARRRYVVRYGAVALAVIGLAYAVVRFTPLTGAWWGTIVLLPVVPLAAHAKWSAKGYALGDDHIVTRNGYLVQTVKVVPYDRVQVAVTSQTVFQRRRDLATLTVDTAGSHSLTGRDPQAVDIDAAAADRLRDHVEQRLYETLAERRGERRRERTASLTDDGDGDDGSGGGADPSDGSAAGGQAA
jgi:putative membrane protein